MTPKISRRPALLGLVATAAVLLTACGGSGGGTAPAAAGDTGAAAGAGNAAGGGRNGAGPPGVTGKIAEAAKGTLQVQDTDSQTTVTYTASTAFSRTVAAKVKVGDCVTAVGTPAAGATDALTATSVVILPTRNGDCTLGNRPGGARGTARPSGVPRPSGAPTDGAPGAGGGNGPGGNGQRFATAVGKVTSVSGNTVVLSGVLREGGRAGAGNGSPPATPSAPPATPTAKPVTVTLAASATVTATAAATSAAAAVGRCASAVGKADSSGTVAATSITISTPGANGCTRFGGFGGRRGGGGG